MTDRIGVLFVCLGNICRSPIAEGVFLHLARERGVSERFRVDSAGTGHWHVGNPPDPRARAVARRHGVELVGTARLVDPASDFAEQVAGGFHWLVGMDLSNVSRLLRLGAPPGRVRLLRSFGSDNPTDRDALLEVPDPYSSSDDGFEEVFHMIHESCERLLDRMTRER